MTDDIIVYVPVTADMVGNFDDEFDDLQFWHMGQALIGEDVAECKCQLICWRAAFTDDGKVVPVRSGMELKAEEAAKKAKERRRRENNERSIDLFQQHPGIKGCVYAIQRKKIFE